MVPGRSILRWMDGFWVRQNGRQFWAGDLDAVIRMLGDGRLTRADEVYVENKWMLIADHPPFARTTKADPFEAWNDADGVDADSAYQSYVAADAPRGLHSVPRPADVAPRPPVPLRAAPTPPPPTPPTREPVRPPVRAVSSAAPEADPDEETDPGIRQPTPPRGEVIDFPRPPAPRPIPISAPPPSRRAPRVAPPLVRPGRVLAYIVVGALGLGAWFSWVRWAGTTDVGISEAPKARAVAIVTDTELDKVDRGLRALLAADPRPIKGEGALADALLVDLQHMRIDVVTVDAVVTESTGRTGEQPVSANLRVVLASSNDLDRTVGAIALVVGRYARSYRLSFPEVSIVLKTAEGERVRSLDAKRAEEYYMDRVSLEKMLE